MNWRTQLAIFSLLVVSLLAPACGAAPAPTPSPAPAKTSVTSAAPAKPSPTIVPDNKPSASAPPANNPSASPATKPAGSSQGRTDWKIEWDKLVAAAEKESKVVVAGPRGELYRQANMEFQKAYPNIQVEYTGFSAPEFLPKIIAEREGGQYLWDVYVGGSEGQLTLKNKGALDPLKPALLLPEVLDDSKWLNGYAEGWLDLEREYIYQFMGYISFGVLVNRDAAPLSELGSLDQIVEPQWKGKTTTQDPRQPSAASTFYTHLLQMKGEDWLRKLLAQDLAVMRDPRMVLEGLVRGKYPIGIGVTEADLQQFKQEGLTANVVPLDPDNPASSRLTAGSNHIGLVNKGSHPNAAKVFANWLLSQQGQQAYAQTVHLNSRRLDVPGPAESAPNPNLKYVYIEKEDYVAQIERAKEISREMLK